MHSAPERFAGVFASSTGRLWSQEPVLRYVNLDVAQDKSNITQAVCQTVGAGGDQQSYSIETRRDGPVDIGVPVARDMLCSVSTADAGLWKKSLCVAIGFEGQHQGPKHL